MYSAVPRALAVVTAAVLLLSPALTACGSSTPAPAAPASNPAPAGALAVTDSWVKPADAGMTAVFGTLTATGAPVTVASATTSASARAELHEVVMDGGAMTMRPKAGGFVVDPGAPHVLEPGADHLMILDLGSPLRPGDQVRVTLTLSDGRTVEFTALAKETTSGEERYADHPGMG